LKEKTQKKSRIEKEKAERKRIEKEKAERKRIEQQNNSQITEDDYEEDDWVLDQQQIELIRAQQAMTFQTINLVRESVTNKRTRDGQLIEEAPPVVPLEQRNITVFAPSSTPFDPRSIDIPDDFYQITKADLQLNAAIKKEKKKNRSN